ncbi:MAG TPA: folylpolyglutamate synthase/dihydrofolate synthase family protein, partial [Terriglobales bacterium]|nr:folylpolyglutamate synthase/dihydrofolate synthase family protein [Terriglobales bacterium]
MPVTYQEAVSRLLALGHELTSQRKFDLDHMRVLAGALGHPERRLQSVLIAGTNGKGSTAATLASIVQAAGIRTGLYTSPHLVQMNERVQIDGEPISDAEFALLYDRVRSAAEDLVEGNHLPWHPSFFEMLTAMMFEYFSSAGVELAVLEVGMGGRLDATNIVEPCLSVITDIDFDHQKFLGDTLPEIAREKAGIIRPSGTVVLLPQHPQVNETLGREIMERNARPVSAVKNMPPVTPLAEDAAEASLLARNRFPVVIGGQEILIDSPLAGRHQLRNLALAITAAEELKGCGFRVEPRHIEAGIRKTQWPGRFQVVREPGLPETVLDVAHNPAGAWALRSALSTYYEGRKLVMVFGAMRDKAIAEIASILFPLGDRIVITHADSPRAATPQEIAELTGHTQSELVLQPLVPAALEHA